MSAQITFADTLPRHADTEHITLAKILQRENELSGVSGTSATQIIQGSAGEAVPSGPPPTPALPAIWYPNGGGETFQWDVATQAWV